MVNENRNIVRSLSENNGASNGHVSVTAKVANMGNAVGPRRIQKTQGYDWLGAVLRRKGILLFTVVVSAVLGYLYYLQQPKVYAAQLKLMIWTQQPPRLMESEAFVQPVSTGKYLNLISSQKVLEKAAKAGNLSSLRTFEGNSAPQYQLKSMLKVQPVEGAADTLLITAQGPDPKDLPEILIQVVAAFEEDLLDSSAAFNKESADVFKMFQDKLAADKSSTEDRFRELIQKLGISPDPNTRQYVNPYLRSLEDLKELKANEERELRDINERINNLRAVYKQPSNLRDESLRVLGIEASKFLEIDLKTDGQGNVSNDALELRIAKTQARVDILEDRVAELRLEELKTRRTVGEKHPAANAIAEKVNYYASDLNTQRELLRRLKAEAASGSVTPKEATKPSGTSVSSGAEGDLIKFYAATLDRNAKRLQNSIESLNAEMAETDKKAVAIRGDIEELNMTVERIQAKDADLTKALDKLSTLTLLASNYNGTKVSVIDPPALGYQVEPKLFVALSLFLFAGSLVGFGVIVLLDWSDLSFRNPGEIKERLGLPVVARISKMEHSAAFKEGHVDTLVAVDKPKSPVAEAYRACKTAMLFMAKQQNMKCFLITSPAAGDGKSTTSLNLAVCFAQGGQKTVIVDADLRRPRCHAYLGVTASPGLKDYAVGDNTEEEIIRASAVHPNLSIVTAGRHFSNPSQFIDSAQFAQFLSKLREEFDIVIVDSPPVLPVADAMGLSSLCDGVLLVMKIRKGVVLSSEKACETLRSVNANMLGVVVNQVEKMSYYSDYGKYGYNGYGGYAYYAGRYYGKQNDKYYENETSTDADAEQG